MSFDAHSNLAVSAIAIAPSPAGSGTSLTVSAGTGTIFPAVPFNALVWPTGVAATRANAEIVRVTLIAGDIFTITRAQEGTSARTILVGDQIANTITAKTLTDVEAPRTIPVTHLDIVGPSTTSSAVLVDIPASTITITNTISAVLITFLGLEVDLSAGANTTVGIAVNIDGVDSDEVQVFLAGASAFQSVTQVECSGASAATPVAPGLHTIKGRYRVVSGPGTARVTNGDITAIALQCS